MFSAIYLDIQHIGNFSNIRIHIYKFMCIEVCIHTHGFYTYTYMHTSLIAWEDICAHTHIHTYIYIYTHTHTECRLEVTHICNNIR
jgi:hypothetical protein